jgi:anti-sigma B factor antagonist
VFTGLGGLVSVPVTSRRERELVILQPVGELDVYTGADLRDTLTDLVSQGHVHLVVDLDAVTFMDSTGLDVLVGGLKSARARGGSLQIVCRHARILRVFTMTGLHTLFHIHESLDPLVSEATSGRCGTSDSD